MLPIYAVHRYFRPRLTLQTSPQHRYYRVLLALLSGVCFWLAWPPNRFAPLLWVALVPLLLIENHIAQCRSSRPCRTFYTYVYGTLFLWNITTTWWVAHATVAGAIFMLFVNTLCMSLPWLLFQLIGQRQGYFVGYLFLVTCWISMEHIHLLWEFSFPWLNLGNGFARWPEWVQWYEYTGVLGGTLWILVANLLIFLLISTATKRRKIWQRLGWGAICWILLPVLGSYYMYATYQEHGEPVEIVVIQPNIDPHTGILVNTGEYLSPAERLEYLMQLSAKQLTQNTRFLVWPETALEGLFDEQILDKYSLIGHLIHFKKKYAQLSLLTGVNSLVGYSNEKKTKTARLSHKYGYYDIFNTALFVSSQGILTTYHKSKLVPGVELVPYVYQIKIPKVLVPPGVGSQLYSLGTQDHPIVFFDEKGSGVAPIICYESIYGGYLTEFIRMGASFILCITIDGWWQKTPGHLQHFHYTRLRAIENRRSIARSALKGISAFINQRGDILEATQYDDRAAMRHALRPNGKITFYVRHCNCVANVALWVSFLIIIMVLCNGMFTQLLRRQFKSTTIR